MIFDNNIGDYIDNKEEDYLLISEYSILFSVEAMGIDPC